MLLVDHQDSFVHTLAGYFREQGAEVLTLRAGLPPDALDEFAPDLVVLSPGPGRPADFACEDLLASWTCAGCRRSGCAWACRPWWSARAANWRCSASPCTANPGACPGIPRSRAGRRAARWAAGRVHRRQVSLAVRGARAGQGGFEVTAVTPDGVVMAIEDPAAGRWAVQFHPESILTAAGGVGHQVVANVLRLCRTRAERPLVR